MKKRALLLALSLLLSFCLLACETAVTESEASEQSLLSDSESVVLDASDLENNSEAVFESSKEELWTGIYVMFKSGPSVAGVPSGTVIEDATKYKDYVSEHAEYNTYHCFSQLGEKEQWIYRILEYAFDNSYSNIWLDEKLLVDLEYTFWDILIMFTMDSPLAEQNIMPGQLPFTTALKDDDGNYVRNLNGSLFYVGTFFQNKQENKTEAIKKAREILDSMPNDLSDMEKAKWFYRYLGENVEYYNYGRYESAFYLYDALCKGASNCDGYTNAFSLLCNMSGIPCIEKVHHAEEGEEAGHTWAVICIDDVWYNVDCVSAKTEVEGNFPVWFYFGYSDERDPQTYEYASFIPECTEDLVEIDCAFEKDENQFVLDVWDVLKTGRDHVTVYSEKKMELSDFAKDFLLISVKRSYRINGWKMKSGYYYVFDFDVD